MANNALTNLNGLNNLTSIGGNLSILGNSSLIHLTGLETLTSILGDLAIYSNNSLTNLEGLNSLTTLRGSLYLGYSKLIPERMLCPYIGNQALVDLKGLSGLTKIGGDLDILGNKALPSLIGLENLTLIGGTLTIMNNLALAKMDGLDNLTSIEGSLRIGGDAWCYGSPPQHNPILSSLTGLKALASIGGDLRICYNDNLSSLSGLEALNSIGGHLTIKGNKSLSNLTGLDNINASSIVDLSIFENESLSNCAAQSICNYLANPSGMVDIHDNATGCNKTPEVASGCGITSPCLPHGIFYLNTQFDIDDFQVNYPGCFAPGGDVIISGKDISNLNGLSKVVSIGGNLQIGGYNNYGGQGNPILTSLTGLKSLTSIGGGLNIVCNEVLLNLTGLEALTSIGGNLQIGGYTMNGCQGNPILTSLTGLKALSSLGGNLDIMCNDSLTSLTGLDALTTIPGDLNIRNNISLSTCEVQSICDFLANPNGANLYIWSNAAGCNSPEQVKAACATVSVDELAPSNRFTIYPNPATNKITVSTIRILPGETRISITSISGQQLIQSRFKNQKQFDLDVSMLSEGIYLVKVQTTAGIETKKLVIQ